jgi:flagellar hook assembly protein FlgD
LSLEPNAPNPFTDETRVAYSLPERGRVRLAVYDVAGREVAVLANGVQDAGHHNQSWDGRASHGARLTAGVYFARLEFGGRVEARKMVLTR